MLSTEELYDRAIGWELKSNCIPDILLPGKVGSATMDMVVDNISYRQRSLQHGYDLGTYLKLAEKTNGNCRAIKLL